jgi:hypothetical protein
MGNKVHVEKKWIAPAIHLWFCCDLGWRARHGPIYVVRRDAKASKKYVPRVPLSSPLTAPSRTRSMRRDCNDPPVEF